MKATEYRMCAEAIEKQDEDLFRKLMKGEMDEYKYTRLANKLSEWSRELTKKKPRERGASGE